MKRVDELSLRWIDGCLSEAEQAELRELSRSAETRLGHLRLCELEAALRAEGRLPDVVESTLSDIARRSSEYLERSVMRAIATLPAPAWGDESARAAPGCRARPGNDDVPRHAKAPRRYVPWVSAAALLTVLAATAAGVWALRNSSRTELAAVVLETNASVVVDSQEAAGQTVSPVQTVFPGQTVSPGQTVFPGQTLRSQDQDSRVTFRYPDGTRLELFGEASLRFERSAAGGKQLRLLGGVLRADVAPQPSRQPLILATPEGQVRVLGTRLEVAAIENSGTRIDLESGRVELVGDRRPPMSLASGSTAFIPNSNDPIDVRPLPVKLTAPEREATFRGVRSLSFDGETILAATRWQAVYWSQSDRLEAVPVSPRGRDGLSIDAMSGRLLAVVERKRGQAALWDAGAAGRGDGRHSAATGAGRQDPRLEGRVRLAAGRLVGLATGAAGRLRNCGSQ